MSDVPNNLTQLIAQLKAADLSKLASSLETIAKGSNTANKAAASLLKNLQAGMKEQEAMASALKKTYGSLIDDENRASEAAKARLKAMELVKTSIGQQTKEYAHLTKLTTELQKQNAAQLKNNNDSLAAAQQQAATLTKQLSISQKLTASNVAGAKAATTSSSSLMSSLPGATGFMNVIERVGTSEIFREGASFITMFGASQVAPVKQFLSTMMSEMKTLYNELSNVTTAFAGFTGQVIKGDAATKNLAGRVITLQRRNKMLGATIKGVTEMMTSLTKASRTYGLLTGTNRKQNIALADGLTEMGIRFKKVGLGAEGFSKALDVIGKTYRKSNIIKQGKSLGAELVNIARVTGQSADVIANDFGAAMTHLAAYSLPKAREEFKKLSAISAVTGVEMSKMLTVATKFDDIETAANAVGELNAMMGGPYLNTLDLVNATEAERIEMLKNMMTQSGETFNQMDRFKQKAIAKAIGSDVQEASRLFSGSQGDIDSIGKSIDSQGASYHRLAQSAKTAATSFEEQFAASKQSSLLMNDAFKATDRLMRNVNLQMIKMGEMFKQTLGKTAVGTLNAANNKVNQIKEQFVSWDGTMKGTFKLIKSIGGELIRFGILGGDGAGMQMLMSEGLKNQTTGEFTDARGRSIADEEREGKFIANSGIQGAGESAATAALLAQTTALQTQANANMTSAKSELAKATADFTVALGKINNKKIEVNLNVDGQTLATAATGLWSQQ